MRFPFRYIVILNCMVCDANLMVLLVLAMSRNTLLPLTIIFGPSCPPCTGLLPLALGSGEPGREIEGPMATIIVGGLTTSTLLNLLVLPAMLLHFGRFAGKEP